MEKNRDSRTDQQLVELVRSGDTAAFGSIAERYQFFIYSFILTMIDDKDLAKDFMQDTLMKALTHLRDPEKDHDSSGSVKAWLVQVARRLCIDHFRKMKRSPVMINAGELTTDDEIVMPYYEKSAEEKMVARSQQQQVRECIQHLCSQQQDVIYMNVYCEMKFKEIAKATGLSINTILGQKRYALRRIGAEMAMAV